MTMLKTMTAENRKSYWSTRCGLIKNFNTNLMFFSRDITVPRPAIGDYYFLLVAYKDFHELLVTAIMDTPPDENTAAFTIRRMGEIAI
jgi:hypothetical protein